MSVSNEQLQRAIAAARAREAQGYFARVKAGDQRAASLFARLVANDLNPSGYVNDYGWLSKSPGESQVDGYAEDAICGNADPNDLANVVDLVNGAGAPGASIGGAVKERRSSNKWVKPLQLTTAELDYLLAGGQPIPSHPPEVVQPYPDELSWWPKVFDVEVAKRYQQAGKVYPDGPAAFRWASRTAYDIRGGLTKEESLAKHLKELEQELGLP